jgi:hypothetical protein
LNEIKKAGIPLGEAPPEPQAQERIPEGLHSSVIEECKRFANIFSTLYTVVLDFTSARGNVGCVTAMRGGVNFPNSTKVIECVCSELCYTVGV